MAELATATILHRVRSADYCGHGTLLAISPDRLSVRFTPLLCGSWICSRCAKRKVRLWRARILDAAPTRWMTLTIDRKLHRTPLSMLTTFKRAFPLFVRAIRKSFGPFHYVAVYERHKSGFPHLHVAYRGTYLPQKWLSRLWFSLTFSPVVDIRKIPNERALAHYITKYIIKSAADTALHFAGLRIITTSRGFIPPDPHLTATLRELGWTIYHVCLDPTEVLDSLVLHYRMTAHSTEKEDTLELRDATPRAPPRCPDKERTIFHHLLQESMPCLTPPNPKPRSRKLSKALTAYFAFCAT